MPIGRYELDNYNSELVIKSVQKNDEGDYECKGMSVAGQERVTIQVDVQCKLCHFSYSSPIFDSAANYVLKILVIKIAEEVYPPFDFPAWEPRLLEKADSFLKF